MRDERSVAGVRVASGDLDADELRAGGLRAVVGAERARAVELEHADDRVVAAEQRDVLRVARVQVDREAGARDGRVRDARRRQVQIVHAEAHAAVRLEHGARRAATHNVRHRALFVASNAASYVCSR